MRLICPNCDAEYQVDDAAIPDTGRDVQCSNCGHAWFQLHADADAEVAQDAEDALFGDTPTADAVAQPPQAAAPMAVVAPIAVVGPIAVVEQADVGSAGEDAAMRPVAARQSLAESVLSVLREEAQRETAVRREETPADIFGSVETQPDLGLQDVVQAGPTSAAARHIARLKGADPDIPKGPNGGGAPNRGAEPDLPEERDLPGEPDFPEERDFLEEPDFLEEHDFPGEPSLTGKPDLSNEAEFTFEAGPRVAARRDLLPDIEEINSTLRANADRAKDDDDQINALPDLRSRRGAFRSGFVLTMIAAVVLAMAYIMAPRIIAEIPGTASTMRVYVGAVDCGRLWLDGVMKSASGSLRGLTGDAR